MKRDRDSEEWKPASPVSSLLPKMCAVLCMASIIGMATKVCVGQKTIASKQNRDSYISLVSKSGKLVPEKQEYCVSFSSTRGGEPIQVEDVFVEFAQQVGRISERPKKLALSPNSLGRYCGEIDLGKQYYQPAFYYVTVHYADGSKKKRTCRFFSTVK